MAVRTVATVGGADALALAVAAVGEGGSVVEVVAVEGSPVEPPAVAAKAIPPAIAATDNPAMATVMRRFFMIFLVSQSCRRTVGWLVSVKGSIDQAGL
jgi:hypothetical protein